MEKKTLELVAHTIWEKKGEDIIVLDMRHLTTLAEYCVIATGNVERHINAMADAVIEILKKEGISPFYVEGANGGDWEIVDFGDLSLHLFTPEAREWYRIENVWSESKIMEIKYPTEELP